MREDPRKEPVVIKQVIVPLVPAARLYGPEQLAALSPSIEYWGPPPVPSRVLEQFTDIETLTRIDVELELTDGDPKETQSAIPA